MKSLNVGKLELFLKKHTFIDAKHGILIMAHNDDYQKLDSKKDCDKQLETLNIYST